MKKVLSVILTVLMVTCILPTVSADVDGYYTYSIENGEATIEKVGKGISGDIIIPSELGGAPVTKIYDYAFNDCTMLESIFIPASVTTIRGCPFKNCNNLANITVENGNPNYHSAGNCLIETATGTLLAGANNSVIPDDNSVTSIANSAFYGRNSIKSITIPDGVTSIEKYAFWQCKELTDVNIPNSVTCIGAYSFSGCNKLANISIPDNVTDVGSYAFYDTEWLQNQADGVVYIGKVAYVNKGVCDETVHIKDGTVMISPQALENCTELVNLFIPNSVTTISSYAFAGCSNLTNIALHKSVNFVGICAFGSYSNLNVWYSGKEKDKDNIVFDRLDHMNNYDFINANWNYYKLGDVDTDNIIGGPDALAALQVSVGKKEITFGQTAAADVDGNGVIESTDALLILQFAVDKIDKFPAE
ncbi:MAG: leucine-rich repeat protein [Clostridia bacterium]|nr:leucine-rich repeat protein [Clostridia bacterium]